MNISSFTSASTLPAKVIGSPKIISDIKNQTIKPLHIQVNPTNKCPFNCSFCSCKKRDKTKEWTLEQTYYIINEFHKLGTEACTITGGGDPLAFPYIETLIQYLWINNIESGLVTNALLLNKIEKEILSYLTWCRISLSSENKLDFIKLKDMLVSGVDWAFSFVLTKELDCDYFKTCVDFANENKFTHIRVVDDILENTNNMSILKEKFNDPLIIWQGRKHYNKGISKCLLSLIKPNIGPDGNVYPCCGIQYANDPPSLDFDINYSMGNDYKKIWEEQKYYCGKDCKVCYYDDYNNSMNIILNSNNMKHKKFI